MALLGLRSPAAPARSIARRLEPQYTRLGGVAFWAWRLPAAEIRTLRVYREMDMRFWLEKAEAEITELTA